MKTRLLIIALTLNLASATLMLAQQQTGPSGIIGWSESAILCKALPTSAPSSFNYVTGAVTFTATSYGTIGLLCTVPGIANQLAPDAQGLPSLPKNLSGTVDAGVGCDTPGCGINSFAFSFLDPGGQAGGCSVSAYLVDRTTGLNTGWSSGSSWSGGVWTVDVGLNPSTTYPVNTKHFYEVDIYLSRPESAVGVCNPTAYGAYLEFYNPIQ
jgi:hypothetical protein